MTLKRSTPFILLILAAATFLRFWQLADHPPGWRDDELINSLVISQHALDGRWQLYYADASGHEGLYHILNALPLYLFGPSAAGIRLLSVLMGIQTIGMTFLLGREMLERDEIGLIAAAGMTVSFWSLMYSRIGLRHISLLFFVLPCFYFLWRSIRRDSRRDAIWSGIFLGLTFYTYFASRGVPLIIGSWLAYLLLYNRKLLNPSWAKTWTVLGIGIAMAIPLFVVLQQQPEAEARVAELAVPIIEAQKGNYEPLVTFTVRTLNMFHSDGDDEYLYNIPGRPLFGPIVAAIFWVGIAISLWQTLAKWPLKLDPRAAPYAFLFLWWLAGISPAFISVPPGSLSHTILAQPAVYLILAVPLVWFGDWLAPKQPAVILALSLIVVALIGWRDLPAYFVEWPDRGNVRFLYRADLHGVARRMQTIDGISRFGITSQLLGPWDRLALQANLDQYDLDNQPVLFDPTRVVMVEPAASWIGFPTNLQSFAPDAYIDDGRRVGGYRLANINPDVLPDFGEDTCFENGLCIATAITSNGANRTVDLLISVDGPLALPDIPLVSNPPPPNTYAGPRLHVFVQARNDDGSFITGDDALGVDVQTLTAGEKFWQRHQLIIPDGANPATIAVGLYDPMTGERFGTVDGQENIEIQYQN